MDKPKLFLLLITILIYTFIDVVMVTQVYYPLNIWDYVWIWHTVMWIIWGLLVLLLGKVYSYRFIIPFMLIFMFFQIEDTLYMTISTLLGWEYNQWLNLDYRWTWLDNTLSGYIGKVIGYEGATTLSVLITTLLGSTFLTLLTHHHRTNP